MDALVSVAATFAIWAGLVVAGFVSAALVVAWVVVRFIPPRQERIPRHLVVVAAVASALMAAGPAALQIGAIQSLLSFGDSILEARTVILTPFPGSVGSDSAFDDLTRQIRQEMRQLRELGLVRYSIRYIALGPVMEGVHVVRVTRQTFASNVALNREAMRTAWNETRPALSRVATQKIAGSILFATLYWFLMIAAGMILILVSRPELVRVSRAISAREN